MFSWQFTEIQQCSWKFYTILEKITGLFSRNFKKIQKRQVTFLGIFREVEQIFLEILLVFWENWNNFILEILWTLWKNFGKNLRGMRRRFEEIMDVSEKDG